MKLKLTLPILTELPFGVFATGYTVDSPNGANMSNSGQSLRWVAAKGANEDWCIYVQRSHMTVDEVWRHGDKVTMKQNIYNLIDCDEEAFSRYRF